MAIRCSFCLQGKERLVGTRLYVWQRFVAKSLEWSSIHRQLLTQSVTTVYGLRHTKPQINK